MKNLLCFCFCITLLSGCVAPPKPIQQKSSNVALEKQIEAQKRFLKSNDYPTLKRKVAIGRFSNESQQNKSLLGLRRPDGGMDKQLVDMLNNSLTKTNLFIVLDRNDLNITQQEAKLTNAKLNLVGVDTLINGSITASGRKTSGESGFFSRTKKQTAEAKVELNLVDVQTGRIYFSASGAGESSTETSSNAGMGTRAEHDGTLNDKAISAAISDAVNKIISTIQSRHWKTVILDVGDDSSIYISGGKSQGLRVGMKLLAESKGKNIKSAQTGFMISLPGKKIAEMEVVTLFGDSDVDEGSVVKVTSGTIENTDISEIIIKENKE